MYLKNEEVNKRYSIFPIKNPDLWEAYKNAEKQTWVAEEIDLSKDNYEDLSDNEKMYLKNILAFFTISDGLVIENLCENVISNVNIEEASFYYRHQAFIEGVHANMYSLLIDTYIKDHKEREDLFNAMETNPAVSAKAKWAENWINDGTFIEKLIAFACVEGIAFSSVFAGVFWFRDRNKMPGLGEANQLIVDDECHVTGTELLTDKGFIDFREVTLDTNVAQYKDGKITFTKPTRVIRNPYKGEIYTMDGKSTSFAVTPNHEFLVKKNHTMERSERMTAPYSKQKIKDITFNTATFVPHTATLDVDGQGITNHERLLIALQADGCVRNWRDVEGNVKRRGINGGCSASIFISRERKIKRLDEILKKLSIEHRKLENKTKGGFTYSFHIDPAIEFKSLSWVKERKLTTSFCKEFIEEIVLWDGWDYNGSKGYDSTVKENSDIVQYIATLAGYKTTMTEKTDDRKETYKNIYRVFMSNSRNEWVNTCSYRKNIIKEEYEGEIHCVTVPHGAIITKYNNKTLISGNSSHYEFALLLYKNYVKEEYKPSKERILEIVLSCYNTEKVFVEASMPNGLQGLTKEMMTQYVQFVVDIVLNDFIGETHFNVRNPLDYMAKIGLSAKNNFFERRTGGGYTRVDIPTDNLNIFDIKDF